MMAYSEPHLTQDAKECIAAHDDDGADHVRQIARQHAADPKYRGSLKAIAEKVDQLGRSDIAKIILEHL